jgi:hypothetical protein
VVGECASELGADFTSFFLPLKKKRALYSMLSSSGSSRMAETRGSGPLSAPDTSRANFDSTSLTIGTAICSLIVDI